MPNPSEVITQLNKTLTHYSIEFTDTVTDHAGNVKKDVLGYAVRNTKTGVIEYTSYILPELMFQAQHFDSILGGFLAEDKTPESLANAPIEDVIIN